MALLLLSSASYANDEQTFRNEQKIDRLLNQLESIANQDSITPQTAMPGRRRGKFIFNLTIKRVTTNNEPMECSAYVRHYEDGYHYTERANGRVTWSGNVGKCSVVIAYDWTNANTSGTFGYYTDIGPRYDC